MRAILLSLVLLGALTLNTSAARAETIGVALPGTTLVFYRAMFKGIARAAEEEHVQLLIRTPSDGAYLDVPNLQMHIINYLVSHGVSGVVLAPEPMQHEARVSLSVPVVLVDRDSANFSNISTVCTDNFAAGRRAAYSLVPVLQKGARVAVLRGAPNVSSTTARENGFVSVAREKGWDVVIDAPVGFRPRDAEVLIDKTLKAYPRHLDAVFAPSEMIAYGAMRVVESMALGDRPRLVVFDWRPEFRDGLAGGVIYADVVQNPYRMGYLAVVELVEALRGHPPTTKVFVDVITVTAKNLNDPVVRSLLMSMAL